VLGLVDQDDPGPQVSGVAGPGLVEGGGDHQAKPQVKSPFKRAAPNGFQPWAAQGPTPEIRSTAMWVM
jgi:hypothetical protein